MTPVEAQSRRVQLGLGLLSIGRREDSRSSPPSEDDALELLDAAITLGIRFFDTAPAYGSSERILGRFLTAFGAKRSSIVVATKMGEHWNAESGSAYADHSYDTLCRSLDKSLGLLGAIDILQLHKATAATVVSRDVLQAIEHARRSHVAQIGASVSDIATAELACRSGHYAWIQFPYNMKSRYLQGIFDLAQLHGKQLIVNRPLAMGELFHERQDLRSVEKIAKRAFAAILANHFAGVVLVGTKSRKHLEQNLTAFRQAAS